MLKWLQHFNQIENIRINTDREEFESLRSEMKYYLSKQNEKPKEEHKSVSKPLISDDSSLVKYILITNR